MTPRRLVIGVVAAVLLLGRFPASGGDPQREPTAADKALVEASRTGDLEGVHAALQAGRGRADRPRDVPHAASERGVGLRGPKW